MFKESQLDKSKEKEYNIPEEVEELANDLGGGWWNYRFIEQRDEWTSEKTGKKYHNVYFTVKEIYYDKNGVIWAWTENDVNLDFTTPMDVKYLFKSLKKAIKKTVLKIENDKMIDTGKRMKDYTENDLCNFSWEEEHGTK